MGFNEILERILAAKQDLTREKVLKMVEEKKREAKGYFTDEGAARIVASELGVEILRKRFQPYVLIQDLVSGLNDVTITGRVLMVYPPKTFSRRDGTEGKVVRLLIADKSGTLKTVLWDDKVTLVEEGRVEQGQIIRVLHGYVRKGLDGKLEVHLGARGSIQVPTSKTEGRDDTHTHVTTQSS